MSGISPDYVEVADRIVEFYQRFPNGSLQGEATPVFKGDVLVGWIYKAVAYRAPEDFIPAHGYAWEPVPGLTNFTRGSELMNAETSAWGRAIVAVGIPSKKVASANEVRNRQEDKPPTTAQAVARLADTPVHYDHDDTPACPSCGEPLKLVPAGVSKATGKAYDAFAACSAKCGWKPSRENPTMGMVA